MKKEYVNFICALHGYSIRVKEIHWNTSNNSEHLLCDELNDCIFSCEDAFAECCMGIEGKHFQIGKLEKSAFISSTLICWLLSIFYRIAIELK